MKRWQKKLLLLVVGGSALIAACDDPADELLGGRGRGTGEPATEGVYVGDVPATPVSGLRRLSQREYDATVRDLLGDTTNPSRKRLPPDTESPFDNDFTMQTTSSALIEGAELLAAEVSARFLSMSNGAQRDKTIGCVPTGAGDKDCFRHFVTTIGRRALRHTLSEADVGRYLELQAISIAENDFYAGVDVALRAMLQDPQFLYRVEIGTPAADQPDVVRLNDWEVATRLSYLLWGSTPDDRLLDRAADGKLRTPDDVRAAATDLLADPRARAVVERFHAMWIGYAKSQLDSTLGPAMQQETAALISRVVFDEKRPWQDIFRWTETFVPDALAKHYGLATHGSDQPAWTSYGSTGRRGILSQASFLSLGPKFDDTSPTLRGKAVRTRLLCETIPPPPPRVNADAPPPKTSSSSCKIDRYKQISADPSCRDCHSKMDPIGFGLEGFDAKGRYRAKENVSENCPIEGKGEIVGVGTFDGPSGLGDVLVKSGKLNPCLITQIYRFAMGTSVSDPTAEGLKSELLRDRAAEDFRFEEVLLDLASHPSFGFRKLGQ